MIMVNWLVRGIVQQCYDANNHTDDQKPIHCCNGCFVTDFLQAYCLVSSVIIMIISQDQDQDQDQIRIRSGSGSGSGSGLGLGLGN